MKTITIFFLCLLHASINLSIEIDAKIDEEGHSIYKRFAETDHEFSHREVANVLYENEYNSFHRITKRDLRSMSETTTTHRIRLERASGSPLHFNLIKRSLFDHDSQFHDNTEHGLVKRSKALEDCYLSGELVIDGKAGGMVSVALCDGLHGTAQNDEMQYYIHPVENGEGDHMVHIFSKRETKDNNGGHFEENSYYDTPLENDIYKREVNTVFDGIRYKREVNEETYKTATSFVIEMAVFVDAKFYEMIHERVPGREDEYILIAWGALNAIYSDKEKVGYHATIKIKQYVTWIVDPEEYVFTNDLEEVLSSFCRYTRNRYAYDLHFLHTGVVGQDGPAVGMAYSAGVCTRRRCSNLLLRNVGRWTGMAHEIGHNLGFSHHSSAACPNDIKSQGGGFMGSGSVNFSPCNKWELQKLFSDGGGQCLFEETGIIETPDNYVNLVRMFPGQSMSPDEQCRVFYGEGYVYFRPFDLSGELECMVFLCINRNEDSPEYLRVQRSDAVRGFPCGDEMFCTSKKECLSWDDPKISWDINYLRSMRKENTWSDWAETWSECSRPCGTGVQIKTRRCQVDKNIFLSPYCSGESVQARLCNEEPCPLDPTSIEDLRHERGSEVCSKFYEFDVALELKPDSTYLAEPGNFWIKDQSSRAYRDRDSCFIMCERDPRYANIIDGIYPDGTPCTDSEKQMDIINRYNIKLRCVQGVCQEMSDCPDNAKKDSCGVCGGDPMHCISYVFSTSNDLPNGDIVTVTTLPVGARNINVKLGKNKQVKLEMWNTLDERILGKKALFKEKQYSESNPVEYAGASWTFDHSSYIRTDGPIDQELIVKATRKNSPVKEIFIDYLLPEKGS